MKYIGGIITSYIVLLVLDIMQRRNHKRTQSLKKFTVRTITDVSIVCAVGAIFVIGAMVFALIDEPEVFKKNTFIMLILVAFLGLMFFGMIAPIKGVWDICVDENDVTVIKAFFYKRHWKISDISYCKRKRGGMNVYVNGRKKKAFFVDGMTCLLYTSLKATVERLRMVAALAPDPATKKLFYMLSVKLSAEGVERWYRCFYCKLRVLKNHRAVSYTHLDVYKRQSLQSIRMEP